MITDSNITSQNSELSTKNEQNNRSIDINRNLEFGSKEEKW